MRKSVGCALVAFVWAASPVRAQSPAGSAPPPAPPIVQDAVPSTPPNSVPSTVSTSSTSEPGPPPDAVPSPSTNSAPSSPSTPAPGPPPDAEPVPAPTAPASPAPPEPPPTAMPAPTPSSPAPATDSSTTPSPTPPAGMSTGAAPATAKAETYAVPEATAHLGPSAAVLLGIATNNLNAGLGGRIGYALANRIYVGGTVAYHFGSSSQMSSDNLTLKGGKTLVYFGPEAGYEIPAGPIIMRPYAGIGPAILTLSTSYCASGKACQDSSSTGTKFAAWAGGNVVLPLRNFFGGADLRGLVVTADNVSSIGVFGTVGMVF